LTLNRLKINLDSIRANLLHIAKLFIQHGADPTIQNTAGKTPLDYLANENLKKKLMDYYDKTVNLWKKSK
jgi:ankyrin repeat protein